MTVGDSVTFSVSASGTPPLSYQWQRNGVTISGATSSSYTIASAQLADNGVGFRCRVANTYGSVTSSSATLAVTANLAPTAGITQSRGGSHLRRRPDDQLLGDRHRSRGRDAARECLRVGGRLSPQHAHAPLHRAEERLQDRFFRDSHHRRDLG